MTIWMLHQSQFPPWLHMVVAWKKKSESDSVVTQLCLTFCDLMGCSPPGSSVHGIILEWIAISFSRGLSRPRDRTQVSRIAGRFFTSWATREAQEYWNGKPISSPADLPDPEIKPGSSALQVDSLPTDLSGKPIILLSYTVVSNSLQPHRLQHVRLSCPSPTPGACSNSCPSSRWCHDLPQIMKLN